MVIGAPEEGNLTGAVYVFEKINGLWTQIAKLESNIAGGYFGFSVAIADGQIVVGSPFEDNNKGATYVFTENGISWNSERIIGTPLSANALFGYSVAIQNGRILVGASFDNIKGAAFFFEASISGWNQTTKLVPSGLNAGDYFGFHVDLDGPIAVMTAPLDSDNANNSGAVYVYELNNFIWQQAAKLKAADSAESAQLGESLDLKGNRIIVGAKYKAEQYVGQGAAYIFNKSWEQQNYLFRFR